MSYSNYPQGAENDPRAPYNQPGQEENEINVTAHTTLSARATVLTSDAFTICDEDEEGRYCYLETCNVNAEYDFGQEHYPVIHLLSELKKVCAEALSSTPEEDKKKRRHLKELMSECDLWQENEFYVEID